jgi:ABC-type sugar transport system substrate-binding protein
MPNAILVEPVNELGLPRVAEAAVNAGIGWVISNARVDYLESLRSRAQAPVFSVSQDHSDIGRILGRQCCTLLPDGGTVLYLRGPASNSLAGRRMEGVESALARNIQFKTLKIQWTEDAAYQTVASWLRLSTVKAKDIQLVASQNTDFILGAIRAFQGNAQAVERANWMSLPFLGVGTASRTKPLIEKGTLQAAVVTSLTMDTAIDLLVNALEKSSQPPENTFVPASSLPSLQELARKDKTQPVIAAKA